MHSALLVLLGLIAGTLSGLIGIGGGIIIIPALVLFFGLGQHHAQGTTLALLVLPIGLLAAWAYYKQGYVDLKMVGYMSVGFLVGGYLGAKLAVITPAVLLEKIFGAALLLMALKMIF